MAVLSDADRRAAWAEFMQAESVSRNTMALTKADLRAAIDAIDDWVEANAAAFNAAIPQPARGALTTRQKAMALDAVVRARFKVAV